VNAEVDTDTVVAMESASEKLEEDKRNQGLEIHADDDRGGSMSAAQSVVCNLRNIGDELCRVRSQHHHLRQHAGPPRYTDITILRNMVCTKKHCRPMKVRMCSKFLRSADQTS